MSPKARKSGEYITIIRGLIILIDYAPRRFNRKSQACDIVIYTLAIFLRCLQKIAYIDSYN